VFSSSRTDTSSVSALGGQGAQAGYEIELVFPAGRNRASTTFIGFFTSTVDFFGE